MKKLLYFLVFMLSPSAFSANSVSLNVERSMVSISIDLVKMKQDSDDIVKQYFSTTASSLVGAAASGDAVTVGSKLTKAKFVAGITVAQQIQNLFTNQAVGTNDYLASAVNLIDGTTAAAQPLSQDVEVIGTNLVSLGAKSIDINKRCQSVLSTYNSSELAAALVPVSLTTIVFGADTTKQLFVDGMNLCQQINNFYGNSAVTQGDWNSVLAKWTQGF